MGASLSSQPTARRSQLAPAALRSGPKNHQLTEQTSIFGERLGTTIDERPQNSRKQRRVVVPQVPCCHVGASTHEDAPTRVTLFLLYFLAVSELDHEILMTAARQPAPERHARFATTHRENECAVIALSSFS